jgi:PAS domain S-box-containing protein
MMIHLGTGELSVEQLELVFGTLPVELTFVDEHDIVRFYNRPGDTVFGRSPDILGRSVLDCHPEKSRPEVRRVLESLKSGDLDAAEFVKQVQGRVMHIRYIAARDGTGTYLGCLEVAQDITRIKPLDPHGA